MSNDLFYSNLKSIKNFNELSNNIKYEDVPTDWYIIVSDIKGSTKAIKDGKYKEVNMVGALTIISILNLNKKLDLPFVFGGDGSFILIPKTLLELSKQALLAVKKLSFESYSLDLRIGIVPSSEVYKYKKELRITKYNVSEGYYQAIIKGGGLEFADDILKNSDKFLVKDEIKDDFILDISGLECRWETVPSPKDEILSILIKADDELYYKDILKNIEKILGDKKERNPIKEENISLSFDNKTLNTEVSLYSSNQYIKYLLSVKVKIINLIGNILILLKVSSWKNYKNLVSSSTDTEKFDDMLRMVVSSDFTNTKKLEIYLEEEYKSKNLIYGIHKADSSYMTCLVFQRHGKHIHFVDSTNGGYAMAAIEFKKRLNK